MLDRITFILLAIIIFVHSLILTRLIYFPYPELFIYPYLTNHGLKPYQQILDQHFPGPMFFPINLDNLGVNDETAARIWSIGIVVLVHILLFFISSKILKSREKALLVNVLFLIWHPFFEGWVLWIDSFLPLVLLPAFYVLYKRRYFFCGLLLGIGIVFKQTLIPLSFLVLIYIFWQTRKFKISVAFLFGLIIPITLMLLFLTTIGVLKDFWYWTVNFNLTVYAKYGRGMVADFAHLSRVALVFGTPLLLLYKIKDKVNQILLIFLGGSLIGLSTRFDFVHFQPALPFAVLATVYGLGKLGPPAGEAGDLSKLGKTLIIGYMLIAIWWLNIFYKGHIGDEVFFFDNQIKTVAQKIKQYTKEDEKIFVFGAPPHLYQMANRLPAGNIFVFQFPWFLRVAGERILWGIKKDKPEIVVSDRTVKIDDIPIIEFAKEIDQYIQQNYQIIDQVGTTMILRRKSP